MYFLFKRRLNEEPQDSNARIQSQVINWLATATLSRHFLALLTWLFWTTDYKLRHPSQPAFPSFQTEFL